MLTAVSRDNSVLSGGISTGIRTPEGIAEMEQIAWITPSGLWHDLPCNYHWTTDADIANCRKFADSYLSRTHSYTIVSANGYGASVQTPPVTLGDCLDFSGRGVYYGPSVRRTAIAASDPSAFQPASALQPLQGAAYRQTLTAFIHAVSVPIHTWQGIRLYRMHWNGQPLVVVERSFTDFASASPTVIPNVKLLFAIGQMRQGRFHILFWKDNTNDSNEQVLGAIRLKSGKQFLLTSVNTPQAQFFRVYAMQKGVIRIVFSGGGSTC